MSSAFAPVLVQPADARPHARTIVATGAIAFVLLCYLCIARHAAALLEIHNASDAARVWLSAPPLTLRYVHRTLAVSGVVRDITSREQLLQRARQVYGEANVVDRLRIESRPLPVDWLETAQSIMLVAGKKLQNGALRLDRLTLHASGAVADEATKQALLNGLVALLPERSTIDDQLVTLQPSASELASTQAQLTKLTQANAIEFENLSPVLRRGSHRLLDRIVKVLERNPRIAVVIEAHTASYGMAKLDLALSQQRAEAVRRYLIIHGIAAQRVSARGYGSSRPLIRANTLAAKLRNRRVEFHAVEPG